VTKKLDVDNLTPEEVQKELLKITIQDNKKLYSINYTLNFIGFVVLISIIITFFGAFIR
jgi:uncharacterized membrane-anchored protein